MFSRKQFIKKLACVLKQNSFQDIFTHTHTHTHTRTHTLSAQSLWSYLHYAQHRSLLSFACSRGLRCALLFCTIVHGCAPNAKQSLDFLELLKARQESVTQYMCGDSLFYRWHGLCLLLPTWKAWNQGHKIGMYPPCSSVSPFGPVLTKKVSTVLRSRAWLGVCRKRWSGHNSFFHVPLIRAQMFKNGWKQRWGLSLSAN